MILHGERVALPSAPLVHKQFESHARATPDVAAVVCGDDIATYAQLDARSNRFAHLLIGRGVGKGSKVGICLDYSVDLLVAILGTLKAGGAYVPLDPAYPAARLALLLGRLPDISVIAVSSSTLDLVESSEVEVVDVDRCADELAALPSVDPDVQVTGDDVCYAVFTSGSTGTPKLTGIRHEGWFNLLNWLMLEYGLHRESNNLVVSAFGFDLSQRSLMAPLFCGATQYLMASRNVDIAMAYRMLTEHPVRTVHCASSTLYLLVDWESARGGEALRGLDYVLFGGEPLRVERLPDWAGRAGSTCTLLHQYGVAECTDVATSYDLAGYRPGEHEIAPVGRPAYNTDVLVLDDRMRPVEAGTHGEIHIAGAGVGVGYLDGTGPERERFVVVPLDGVPRRLYRTGDRGYVNRDGDLVVAGRMDTQVKVRGMRIDPADVERALGRLAEVREAAVVPRYTESGDAELIAFVVPAGADVAEETLRAGLLETLPRSMVPARFVEITYVPLSPHGKVDRATLTAAARDEYAENASRV